MVNCAKEKLYGYPIILVVLMFCNVNKAHSQKEPQYTQYMYNIGSFNPAYVGSVEKPEIALMYRAQWIDIEGAPRTIRVGTNVPFSNGKHGLGFNVVHDELGPSAQTYIDLAYSYQINLTDETRLSFGMDVGGAFLNLDYSKGTFERPDPLDAGVVNRFYPSIGAGLFMYENDIWYLGASIPNFLTDGIYNDDVAAIVEDRIQFNFVGGYVFDLSEKLKFKPAFLVNFLKGAPINANVSTNFQMLDRFTLGASYRINNAVSALAGFQISSGIFLGYSYDYSTNSLGNYNNGSHEVIMKFYLGQGGSNNKEERKAKNKPKQIDTPRFF